MADFDLQQTDAQVQAILNDGQSAMGAGAQTTLTTEYVMLKDVNGAYHKILKDSLTEACRNVLAGLLVNNDKGTTISQLPAIASGDFGSVTPANLASVLGATGNFAKVIEVNSNIDQIYNTGRYCVPGAAIADTLQGDVPVSAGFTMLVYSVNSSDVNSASPSSRRLCQEIAANNQPDCFYRRTWSGSSWTAWFKFEGTQVD